MPCGTPYWCLIIVKVLLKPKSNNTLKGASLRQAVAVAQMLDTAEKAIEGQGLTSFSKNISDIEKTFTIGHKLHSKRQTRQLIITQIGLKTIALC